MKIYTIGHSNLPYGKFLDMLIAYDIRVLADVRSHPYSRYAAWSRKKPLEQALSKAGIDYHYLGKELGGKPFEKMADFYDRERNPLFVVGMQKLITIATEGKTVIMCSEAKPNRCHRQNLIGRHLVNRGWEVIHIQRDGSNIVQQPMLL
jgi:uncharacterized protein (DUF488 family)